MIAGIDEAGRGALAGPVVAACVIFTDKTLPINDFRDSKTISATERLQLFNKLKNSKSVIKWSIINHKIIDKTNILAATLKAMAYCIKKIDIKPSRIIIDGNKTPNINNYIIESCINGDSYIKEISAASIIAKEIRDRIMIKYAKYIQTFNFAKHKGYGTKEHYEELAHFGPSKIHRQSFNLNKQLSLF